VGYRYFTTKDIAPTYPFGYGLSFGPSATLGNLSVQGTGPTLNVSVTVANPAAAAMTVVPQLYVTFPAGAGEPNLQLKGFETLFLPGLSQQAVIFALDARSFSVWDVAAHAWTLAKGSFTLSVGFSCLDLRARADVILA
jgi:beta-glucosidase